MRSFSWSKIWHPTWPPLEVIFRAAIVYLFLQFIFRIVGRKEWTRYATFNSIAVLFLITIALRTTLLGDDSSVTSGIIAISTILGMDWLLSYLSYRSERFSNLINGKVVVLIKHGQPQRQAMRRFRISTSQLLEQIRLNGHSSIEDVETAVLERSGKISVQFTDLRK